jgi:hypothetical protein
LIEGNDPAESGAVADDDPEAADMLDPLTLDDVSEEVEVCSEAAIEVFSERFEL